MYCNKLKFIGIDKAGKRHQLPSANRQDDRWPTIYHDGKLWNFGAANTSGEIFYFNV